MTENPLWALLEMGARLGRRVWRPRKIDISRRATVVVRGLRHTLVQGIDWVQHEGRRTRVRVLYSLELKRSDPSAVDFLLQCVRATGGPSSRLSHGKKGVLVQRPIASAVGIDRSWMRVRDVVAGKRLPNGRAVHASRTWSARELDQLLSRILGGGTKEWTGSYVNFRRTSQFSACGFEWDLLHEGLCNEWDNELSFIVCSRSKVPYDGWRKLKRVGFVESLAADLREHGYRVSMRARWGGNHVFVQFSKPVRIRTLENDVRFHLAWAPTQPFQPRRLERPSPELFLDGRLRMPKG